MDIKYVLSSILRECTALGAVGELQAGVRLTGAVNGERGEGYLLLFPEGLVLLYRKLGKRDYEGCYAALSEWSFGNYIEEKYALALEVKCNDTLWRCEFTPSERESAEILLNAITAAHADPRTVYSEDILLMSALLTVLARQGHEAFAESLLGRQLFLAAGKFAGKYELIDLVKRAGELFSVEQKQSLLLNLIEMRLSDDLWTGEEASALRELAEIWQLEEGFFEQAAGMLLRRRKLGSLFQ